MSEMTKRVGKAVRKALEHVYDYANDDSMDDDIGRAAIEEMRKPTKAMLDNALPHMDSWSSNLAWWDKMIDGALK